MSDSLAVGLNIVRLPVLWERLQPSPQGRLDAAQLALIKAEIRESTTEIKAAVGAMAGAAVPSCG